MYQGIKGPGGRACLGADEDMTERQQHGNEKGPIRPEDVGKVKRHGYHASGLIKRYKN